MLLLQNPLKSVISDMLSGKNQLSDLLMAHWSEITEHIWVFVICNLFINWKFEIWPHHSDQNTNMQLLLQELDL